MKDDIDLLKKLLANTNISTKLLLESGRQGLKEGDTVTVAGVPIKVVSDEECLKADHFVAMPKKQFDAAKALGMPFPADSKGGYFCRWCGQEVSLAPTGQGFAAKGMQPTCMDCMLNIMRTNPEGDS